MGRLSGFRYREVARRLRRCGFEPAGRQTGSHEGWVNRTTQRFVIVPRHSGDVPEGTLRAILRQAGITVEEFLAL